MEPTMVDYLKEYGDVSFKERPFGNADSVVLSQLCYFKFDGLIPDEGYVFLRDLDKKGDIDKMLEDPKYAKENRKLFDALIKSPRFKDLKIAHYVSNTDKILETQFCAVTFALPTKIIFVAFRGTDETMVGWKEDFNLTYMSEVPGHRLAMEYLNEAAARIHGSFYVGGHSKGGHLSIYASMHADPEIQDRLKAIYCLDGPGFMPAMLKEDGYARIRERIRKFLPQSSLVGMLQEHDDAYVVIKSTGVGIMQHNLYTWVVEHGDLVYMDSLKESARVADESINEWIENLNPESRKEFVDALYEIFTACDADDRVAFMDNFGKNAGQVINSMRGAGEETVKMIKDITWRLFEIASVNFKNELESKYPGELENWFEKHKPKWTRKDTGITKGKSKTKTKVKTKSKK
ncbi:MAG: DUF2974 domain-containing protein [Lachnospiraceae bacterium]|nr:DUF2974 domain-containing protein [Lachnospiraceae bacterium]